MLAIGCGVLWAAPEITNVRAHQLPGEHRVKLTYDLSNAGGGACSVRVRVSTDSGANYGEPLAAAAIDRETAVVLPGTGKMLEIKLAEAGLANRYSREIRFQLMANDSAGVAPNGFALIPAGNFTMGDQSNPMRGDSIERPVHTVYVSEFFMAKFETTKELWDEVRAWGMANGRGYTDLPVGNGSYASKGRNHPVHTISWYAMVKWCNARSQMEGLTPCYTVSGATYKTGNITPDCNWSATGYRLPTEAEWEKAARGGQIGQNFPWGNTIGHNNANYRSLLYVYDVSFTQGYHPSYAFGWSPYSSPVGSFEPNGYGLYDVVGNMWEWCWDSYGSYSYAFQSDPRGQVSGTHRVDRGGSWNLYAGFCRLSGRHSIDSSSSNDYLGFRLARSSGHR